MGASGQTTRRDVLPARLVFKGRDWYLQGFCLERAAYRTFKLTRMLEPEPGAPFQRPSLPAHRGRRAAGGLLHSRPPALLPRPCLPGLRRISTRVASPAGRTATLWCR
ncbi:MAG: WYL domain-containing protein [Flavonifractor plautii]